MKIISKYKDFYDYLWIDGDPDLIYVRKPKVCFNLLDKFFPSDYNRNVGKGLETRYINMPAGSIDDCGYTFGIYPFVYTIPALTIKMTDGNYVIKILSKADMQKLETLEESKKREFILSTCKEYIKDDPTAPKDLNLMRWFWRGSLYNDIMKYCWKIELPEIFFKLEAPIFVKYEYELFNESVYEDILNTKLSNKNIDKIVIMPGVTIHGRQEITALTNICFNKLNFPITKYWFDEINNLNTYSNIENFLMTSKLDPEPIISNEGKIIAHGFDLKTSFRKM